MESFSNICLFGDCNFWMKLESFLLFFYSIVLHLSYMHAQDS
ncbi:unnamed protein product, partial [Vitis vinifera]